MTPPPSSTRSIILMLGSVVFFALNVLLVRWINLSVAAADSWMTTLFRGGVGMLVTVGFYGFGRGFSCRRMLTHPLMLLRGALGGFGILLFYITVMNLGAGRSVIINLTYPLFGALIAVVWLKEHLSKKVVGWMILGFGGLVVFIGPTALEKGTSIYDFYGILGAIAAGFVIVLIRRLHRTDTTSTIYASQCLWSFIIAAPLSVGKVASLSPTVMLWLSFAACLVSAGQLMMTAAYKGLPISRGASIQMILPIITAVGGVLLFDESFRMIELVGAVIILLATWRVVVAR